MSLLSGLRSGQALELLAQQLDTGSEGSELSIEEQLGVLGGWTPACMRGLSTDMALNVLNGCVINEGFVLFNHFLDPRQASSLQGILCLLTTGMPAGPLSRVSSGAALAVGTQLCGRWPPL